MDEDESTNDCVEYVHSDTGLYPLPIARNCKSSHRTKIKNKFQFLGKFMAKVSTCLHMNICKKNCLRLCWITA